MPTGDDLPAGSVEMFLVMSLESQSKTDQPYDDVDDSRGQTRSSAAKPGFQVIPSKR